MAGTIVASASAGSKAALERASRHIDRRELAAAEREVSAILAGEPEHAQALYLLGIVRRAQGRQDEAESLYRRSLNIDPANPAVHYSLGTLLAGLGRQDEAVAAFSEAIRLKPNFAEAHLALALAFSDRGDHDAAERSCRHALRYQPNYLLAQQALSTELCALGRPREAELLLRRVLATGVRDPRQAAVLEHNLAMALKQQSRLEESLGFFDAAQAKAPEMPAVDYNRAGTLQQLGRIEAAAQAYARAAARDPAHADSWAGLALMSALTGDFATAGTAGSKAVARHSDQPMALIALSIVDVEKGDYAQADQKLARVLSNPSLAHDRQAGFALGFAADAFERREEYTRAFELYKTSNTVRRALQPEMAAMRASRDVERLVKHFAASEPWPAVALPPAGEAKGHVFVLGFMRSGTTLLQTILATNSDVLSIDEIEFLTPLAREFLLDDRGLIRLSALAADDAVTHRAHYWKSVRDSGLSVAGRILVDKMPFNSLRLPLIARIFPDSRVIFAIRDPRDVVISCFRRRFNPTGFSYEFLDLEDCARFYAASMRLTEHYRQKLPLHLYELRYEDMVHDFDSAIGAVCAFAGIGFIPAMRNFVPKAHDIDRRSASARQVSRGLYTDGIGQWRHYREQMRPVLPILEPWIARFGYSPENP